MAEDSTGTGASTTHAGRRACKAASGTKVENGGNDSDVLIIDRRRGRCEHFGGRVEDRGNSLVELLSEFTSGRPMRICMRSLRRGRGDGFDVALKDGRG